jgi:hypothetical protein
MQVARVEAKGDAAAGRAQDRPFVLDLPRAPERPLVEAEIGRQR